MSGKTETWFPDVVSNSLKESKSKDLHNNSTHILLTVYTIYCRAPIGSETFDISNVFSLWKALEKLWYHTVNRRLHSSFDYVRSGIGKDTVFAAKSRSHHQETIVSVPQKKPALHAPVLGLTNLEISDSQNKLLLIPFLRLRLGWARRRSNSHFPPGRRS